MRFSQIGAAILLAASVSAAAAHGPKLGPNGGQQADAGSLHVEVVSKGTNLVVFLRDQADKPVAAEGYKGTAIFVIGGKPQRIPLAPAGENMLSGTAAVAIPSTIKGAVQITTPSGGTAQAKLN